MSISEMDFRPAVRPTPPPRTMRSLRDRRDELTSRVALGNRAAVERRHSLGKRTARERLELLLDVAAGAGDLAQGLWRGVHRDGLAVHRV